MTSETIDRLKQTMNSILKGATITILNLEEIGRQFNTAIQQVERLEKSRDSWKEKYMEKNENSKD